MSFYNNSLVKPFWLCDTMTNETVTMIIHDEEELAYGMLKFKPKKIISVTNYGLDITYIEGLDYNVSGKKIQLTKNTSISCLNVNKLIGKAFENSTAFAAKETSLQVFWDQGHLLTDNQISVTYEYNKNEYTGPKQKFIGEKLPNTMELIKNAEDISVLFYGDSIFTGCDTSGFKKIKPMMKSWMKLTCDGLASKYKVNIEYKNTSVGGMLAKWGAENVKTNVADMNPNLAFIGFGMNDGSCGIAIDEYLKNIQTIINVTRDYLGDEVEFVLIGTMMPNPLSSFNRLQTNYVMGLENIADNYKGVAFIDIGDVHQQFLNGKYYADTYANNINHPNDFMARLYTMNILSGLISY